MKKQIIISSLIMAALWSLTAIAVFNTASAKESESSGLLANNSTLTTKTPIGTSSETVYVMTDENGNAKSKFIGSTIYDGNENLPFEFKVSYFLDGQEITAKDLAGKSGHIKIIFNYASTARYQNRLVPFVAITNLVLNHSKFANIKLDNGKIVHETPDSYIIAGFSLAGGNSNLGVDFIPETFTLEADVTDFKLENTYTVFDNSLIADLDLSKLTDLDSVVNSIYQLSDGLDKIIAGANTLVDGIKSANEGAAKLADGLQNLNKEGTPKLRSGTEGIITGILNNLNESLGRLAEQGIIIPTITSNNYGPILTQVITAITNEKLPQINTAIGQYCAAAPDVTRCAEYQVAKNSFENVVSSLTQTKELLSGLLLLENGINEYTGYVASATEGSQALSTGLTQLYQGSITLRDGLNTFKTSGIDKLVNFAKNDLSRFTNNLRAAVRAAASYRNFGNTDAKSVKFVVKTPSI